MPSCINDAKWQGSRGSRVSTDTSKRVPLQQRRGSNLTVRTALPILHRCACNFSEMIARILYRSPLFQCVLVPDLAQQTAQQTEAYGYDYSCYKKCHCI